MVEKNKNIRFILDRLGYQEIRPHDADRWKSLDEVGDRYGTTDDTNIEKTSAGKEYFALTNIESGRRVALARKKRPNEGAAELNHSESTDSDECSPDRLDQLEFDRLESVTALPNTHTAAYLLAMACKEKLKNPDYEALVTSANLAVLKAWDEGLRLTDLDKLIFRLEEQKGGPRLEIEGQDRSISVQVKPRSFSLEEPWDGTYSAATVGGRLAT